MYIGIREKKDYEFFGNLFINTWDVTVEGLVNGDTPIAPFFPNHAERMDDFLWSSRVGLQYALNDDLMLYANFNCGVEADSCNSPMLTFLTQWGVRINPQRRLCLPRQYLYGARKGHRDPTPLFS